MYCNGCGQALVTGQAYCPRCGRVNAAAVRPVYVAPVAPSLDVIERRIDALGVAWLVYAGLIAVTGMAGMIFARAWLAGHGGWGPWDHWNNHGWHGPAMPLFFLRLGWIALIGRVALAAAAGFGLLQKAEWARWVAIVAAILSLIHLPFGTAIAVWTLVVLLSANNVAGYHAMAR